MLGDIIEIKRHLEFAKWKRCKKKKYKNSNKIFNSYMC